ncbi:H(+)/Cl(-) exchange transporter [Lachnellula occidentalis]|uniref:Chloride channel protein n=1 Tax=Lachnellula occidentalis TaxID=215460 RepID=A0A8H8UKB3_9HELO|nr:H(+)/Cl(-) exchange transporter [Lachnellula occidentalis]
MSQDEEANEHTQLLDPRVAELSGHRRGSTRSNAVQLEDASSIISSHLSKGERALAETAIGERLPYNDYTTIDWLHDLIKDSYRHRAIKSNKSLKGRFLAGWDSCQGWVAASLIGILTATVAFLVDIAEATISDYKLGYCSSNFLKNRESCCMKNNLLPGTMDNVEEDCLAWKSWSGNYWGKFGIYVGSALLFGIIAGAVTMTTKANLPTPKQHNQDQDAGGDLNPPTGKSMYMAAGSGIPEIKTILSGFVIPHFLDFKVLLVKAVGATFAVATGMCLGKEGPFVHISTCVGYLVASCFPKYRDNGRKMREMLSVACSSGLSVAFGAPIGGVLFSYEEISTYFPRKVLWRAFLCSLFAAVVLKALNPNGTGKLVLFETNYGVNYLPQHYLVFIFLGIVGGLFGGIFCKANFLWSKTFRKYSIISTNPVLELALVVLVTALLQYPNPLTREPGDVIIKNLLVDCRNPEASWVCAQEVQEYKGRYYGWLVYGTAVKLILTIITFGCKVPSGIIIPALDAGALFGRLIGQAIPDISPGIFAMVGAAAFLAGVSRMTVSLTVIMFELTGEVDYIPPFMIAILVAKWVADALSSEGVYDLAQTVLGHPFLDPEHALGIVRDEGSLVEELIPPEQTMREITVDVGSECKVSKSLLSTKLSQLKNRGLMDAGLVLVDGDGMLHGYLAEGELDFAIHEEGVLKDDEPVDLLQGPLSAFVDRTPLTICAKAPMEYAVEMFGKLGLRHLIVVEEGTAKVVGVIIKKRLVLYLENLQH